MDKISVAEYDGQSFATLLGKYRRADQPVAIICSRFVYRGKVAAVGEDHVVLKDAKLVMSTGPSSSSSPAAEEPAGSDVSIMFGSIEIVFQPNWAFHGEQSDDPS